jgi:choice-of-anchor B domain-containing protein
MRFILLSISLLLVRLGGFSQNSNVEFRSLTTYNREMSDIWGYSDGTYEYALATTTNYFSIVDVTDPDNPIKLHQVDGPNTFWRDIKTWGHYAYGVHENTGASSSQGLVIMDLSDLQNQMPVTFWKNDGSLNTDYRAAHNIFIDEFGYAYITGHNFGGGGVLILDLNQDPLNPVVVGQFTNYYVHDCYARNNILYTSDESRGTFSIIDANDKSNLIILASENTPSPTSHNNWLSDDGNTLFTTDENSGAYITAFDISDVDDISELDRYRSRPGVIPHNVFIKDYYAIISYYRDGVIILDASDPANLIEVGRYDTSPNYQGSGFNGAWGVYPYLPSGNILVTDIEEGLYVLTPNYQRATHIIGQVVDKSNQNPIVGAEVGIVYNGNAKNLDTNISGKFSDGYQTGGTLDISVFKPFYQPYSAQYTLANSEELNLVIELEFAPAENSDTAYFDLNPYDTITFCDENFNSINADDFFTCTGVNTGIYGNWTISNNGCITYFANANNPAANYTESVCFISENTTTGEYNSNVVFYTVSDEVTGITNAFQNGTITLIENPVRNHIRLRNEIEVRAPMQFNLYNVSGQLVLKTDNIQQQSLINIPVQQLSSGIYLLEIYSNNMLFGWTKVMKN